MPSPPPAPPRDFLTLKLQQDVATLTALAPRFVFRTCDYRSGGNRALNSPIQITPHAFWQNNDPPPSIHHYSRDEVVELATGHLHGEHNDTPFSSWSHSFDMVLALGYSRAYDRHAKEPGYVAMLDTAKLGQEKVVLYTPEMAKVYGSASIAGYPYEFLIFGIIPGAAYSTVRYQDLVATDLMRIWAGPSRYDSTGYSSGTQSVRQAMKTIRDISELFGKDFAGAAACYILALRAKSTTADAEQHILRFLEVFRAGTDRNVDGDTTLKMLGNHYPDAARAIGMVRAMVVHVHGSIKEHQSDKLEAASKSISNSAPATRSRGLTGVGQANSVVAAPDHKQSYIRRGCSAGTQEMEQERIEEKKRVERALRLMKQLKTDMVGWEWV